MSSAANVESTCDVLGQVCGMLRAPQVEPVALETIAKHYAECVAITQRKAAEIRAAVQTLQATATELRAKTANPPVRRLLLEQEVVRNELQAAEAALEAARVEREQDENVVCELQGRLARVEEEANAQEKAASRQIPAAQAQLQLLANLCPIAFSAPGTTSGSAATSLASASAGGGAGGGVGTGVGAGAGTGFIDSEVRGAVHLLHKREIRPFAYSRLDVTDADIANCLWDAMWDEVVAKRQRDRDQGEAIKEHGPTEVSGFAAALSAKAHTHAHTAPSVSATPLASLAPPASMSQSHPPPPASLTSFAAPSGFAAAPVPMPAPAPPPPLAPAHAPMPVASSSSSFSGSYAPLPPPPFISTPAPMPTADLSTAQQTQPGAASLFSALLSSSLAPMPLSASSSFPSSSFPSSYPAFLPPSSHSLPPGSHHTTYLPR